MKVSHAISFDHYFDYQELTQILQELSAQYPQLMKVSSICTSKEGREVWAVEITNLATGDFLEKPAYYIDGNHHAGEVTGSMACMHTIVQLVTQYGVDEAITALLDGTTVYVIPRVSPDGAETYLKTAEKLRSVNRAYPFLDRAPGLHAKDMDGDGVIRMMRVKTPYGTWKESADDPRLMVKRAPDDVAGTYYNIYTEGDIEDYDGLNIQLATNKWGLDFNRNYPYGWFPEVRQPGAGPYPLSNPENKALVDFVLAHPNIGSADTMHTTGGVIVYPPGTKPEAEGEKRDMAMYRAVGAMATQELGYDCVNIFDEFLADNKNYSSGAYDDWLYQTQGIPAYTVELWDLQLRAGVEGVWPRNASHEKTDAQKEQDYAKIIAWVDQHVGKDAFQPWTKLEHPQLGEVEIGGMDFKFTMQNCPPAYLQQEVEKTTRYCLRHAAVLPHLSIDTMTAEQQAEGVYVVEAVVGNRGYLPTFLTQEALNMKVDQQLNAELTVPQGAEVIMGQKSGQIGHLEGFAGIPSSYGYDFITTSKHDPLCKKLQWVVKGQSGQTVSLCVKSAKAGKAQAEVVLP